MENQIGKIYIDDYNFLDSEVFNSASNTIFYTTDGYYNKLGEHATRTIKFNKNTINIIDVLKIYHKYNEEDINLVEINTINHYGMYGKRYTRDLTPIQDKLSLTEIKLEVNDLSTIQTFTNELINTILKKVSD